jgi:hypothetical protein
MLSHPPNACFSFTRHVPSTHCPSCSVPNALEMLRQHRFAPPRFRVFEKAPRRHHSSALQHIRVHNTRPSPRRPYSRRALLPQGIDPTYCPSRECARFWLKPRSLCPPQAALAALLQPLGLEPGDQADDEAD